MSAEIIVLDDTEEEEAASSIGDPMSIDTPTETAAWPSDVPRHNLFAGAIPRNEDVVVAAVNPAIPRHDLFSSAFPPGDMPNMMSSEVVKIMDEEMEGKNLDRPSQELNKVEILVLSPAERERQKQRRRRLRRMCQRARGKPSFMKLVRANLEVSEDEEEDDREEEDTPHISLEQLPKRIRIDLDAELGLKAGGSTLLYHHATPAVPNEVSGISQHQPTPADEGWYEGTAAACFPEDADFLSPIQQWIRQNIQYFSATEVLNPTGARRSTIVRGRVGLRCLHCAQAQGALGSDSARRGGSYSPEADTQDRQALPVGAAFYPSSILNGSSNYVQKFQQHFSDCLNLPDTGRLQLLSLLEDGTDLPKTSRRSEGGLSNALYNLISARRIGLVDTDYDDGVRFGRDLDCEPLPFSTVRWQVEYESSGSAAVSSIGDTDAAIPAARLAADSESEAVLAENVAESGEESCLCRSEDRALLTDYIFLTMRQMAVCHAVAEDFASRYKKPKLLRIGFAGFCCRWCVDILSKEDYRTFLDYACRCFPSASENLTSVISSSFTVHLQKCKHVPSRLKMALLAYKKLHLRQMAQLPYGSQRRYYILFWSRLRAADKLDAELPETASIPPSSPVPEVATDEKMSDAEISDRVVLNENEEASDDDGAFVERSASFPVCEDADTKALLAELEGNWDPATNDHMILPCDRHLVSDYVFLIMRQLQVVFPNDEDLVRIRKHISIPGLACLHCLNREPPGVSPSGRSFSSAPDNFHSALNSSFFNHMQVCCFVSDSIKRALTNTKKVHSAQCASIKIGSQRKYFNKLYDRLRSLEESDIGAKTTKDDGSKNLSLSKHDFMEIPNQNPSKAIQICLACRMVPLQFRARDSVFVGRAPIDGPFSHSQVCKKSCLDLSLTVDLLDEIIRSSWNDDISVLDRQSFQEIIRSSVLDETLCKFLIMEWRRLLHEKRGIDSGVPKQNDVDSTLLPDMWKLFPSSTVDFCTVEAAFLTFAQEFGDMADGLRNHLSFLNFLLLISPSLVVPKEDAPTPDEGISASL